MKKHLTRVFLFTIIAFAILSITKQSYAASFKGYTEYKKDTYIVPYGKEIKIKSNDGEEITSDKPDIGKVVKNKIQIAGVGKFTITIKKDGNEAKYNFFAWNVKLKKGKYYVYKDENRKNKSKTVHAVTYFALSTTNNKKALKIKEHFYTSGSSSEDPDGKYITNYYDSEKNKSTKSAFSYSMVKKFKDEQILVTKLELNDTSLRVKLGKKVSTSVKLIEPENAANKNVTYEVSDRSILQLASDSKGKAVVIGVGVGKAKLIATASGGKNVKAVCEIEVYADPGQTLTVKKDKYNDLEIYYLCVAKRTDAIFLRVGNKSMFIDGGHYKNSRGVIIDYLKNQLGVKKINYYVGTHSHGEAVASAGTIIREFKIKRILVGPGTIDKKNTVIKKSYFKNSKYKLTSARKKNATYNQMFNAIDNGVIYSNQIPNYEKLSKKQIKKKKEAIKLKEKKALANCKLEILKAGDKFIINDEVLITCIGPVELQNEENLESNTEKSAIINGNSLILRLDHCDKSILLTGDATKAEMLKTIEKYGDLAKVDAYKNAGHSSNKGKKVMNSISPKYTILSTNDFYLPTQEFIELIQNVTSKAKYEYKNNEKPYYIASGNKDGNIRMVSDGKDIKIETNYKNIATKVESMTLKDLEVQVGKKYVAHKVIKSIKPAYALNRAAIFKSSNPDVIKLIENRTFEALKVGESTITVKLVETGITAKCKIKVLAKATGIAFEKDTVELFLGKSERLKVVAKPNNSIFAKLEFSSEDPTIATVDSNGKVTALKEGETTIKVVGDDQYTATCKVKVSNKLTGEQVGKIIAKTALVVNNKRSYRKSFTYDVKKGSAAKSKTNGKYRVNCEGFCKTIMYWVGITDRSKYTTRIRCSSWDIKGVSKVTRYGEKGYLASKLKSKLLPGDIMIFRGRVPHLAIYVGNGRMVEMSNGGVRERSIGIYDSYRILKYVWRVKNANADMLDVDKMKASLEKKMTKSEVEAIFSNN